jgi:hypothetical protein
MNRSLRIRRRSESVGVAVYCNGVVRSEFGIQGDRLDRFREVQHKNWDAAAAGWKERSEFNDSADAHISERLAELAGVQLGSRVWACRVAEPGDRAGPHCYGGLWLTFV